MTIALAILCLLSLAYAFKCRRERDTARAKYTDALRQLDAKLNYSCSSAVERGTHNALVAGSTPAGNTHS